MNGLKIALVIFFKLCLSFGQKEHIEKFDNGEIKVKGSLNGEDKKEGDWTYYFIGGAINFQGEFQNDKRHGKWIFYYGNGRLKQTVHYVDGKISGESNTYRNDSINTILSRTYFKDGIDLGIRKEYYPSGKLKVHIRPDSLNQEIQIYGSYYESGKKDTYGKALKGKILKPGKRIGAWKTYFENGNLKVSSRYIGNTDKIEFTYFYENGNLKEHGVIKDKLYRIGEWKSYYKKGQLKSMISYPDERSYKSKKSIETYYAMNGDIKLKRFYNTYGEKEREIKYENGKPLN